ncbi:lysozyme inhibitor LprI family protein [Gemmobacter nectariphilus]|uniref:lysozyme inhibitor LprI family protein n=1 Tax=Gemmobacter nectariphilus TaxID=220343 RepID=UPI0005555EEF|nr:lysozyme inhibitor LprI family protein [Gemmobacter nectariphilus]
MSRARPAMIVLALLPAPALAQEMRFSPALTEACLAAGADEGCAGRAADACMADNPGGGSTVGMGFCLENERVWWDDRLNAAYKALSSIHNRQDAGARAAGDPQVNRQQSLREMQRAWIGWRDAACAYEAAQWGGGTGAGPAALSCLMEITARQALALESRVMEAGK